MTIRDTIVAATSVFAVPMQNAHLTAVESVVETLPGDISGLRNHFETIGGMTTVMTTRMMAVTVMMLVMLLRSALQPDPTTLANLRSGSWVRDVRVIILSEKEAQKEPTNTWVQGFRLLRFGLQRSYTSSQESTILRLPLP